MALCLRTRICYTQYVLCSLISHVSLTPLEFMQNGCHAGHCVSCRGQRSHGHQLAFTGCSAELISESSFQSKKHKAEGRSVAVHEREPKVSWLCLSESRRQSLLRWCLRKVDGSPSTPINRISFLTGRGLLVSSNLASVQLSRLPTTA